MPAIGIENTHVRGSHVSGRGSSAPIGDRHAGLALAAAVLGFFVVTLDAVVVNMTLPIIRTDLGGGVSGLQWVVDGYTLMFAALLLSAGSPRRSTSRLRRGHGRVRPGVGRVRARAQPR